MSRRLRRRYGRSSARDPLTGTPELALFHAWRKAARLAKRGNAAAYRAMDELQYRLQDMSALGRSLVWGPEGRKRGM